MAVTAATVLAGISAASSLVSGMQQQAEAGRQARQAEATAILQGEEQARVASKEAGIAKDEAESARRQQKLAYLKSGVSLEGSPFLTMEQTRLQGQRNVNEILSAGAAGRAATMQEGRTRAKTYKASGRQAFISGLGNAAKTGASFIG